MVTGLSDVDLDRIEESPRAATDRHVVQLVAEVRRLREASANAAALFEEVWTLKGEMADLGKRATNAIELAKADRDRLADAIRTHRDDHLRLDKEDMNHLDKELARGEADIALWAALDQEDDGG